MRSLINQMRFVAGQLLAIVRILLRVLLKFFKANPYLTTGIATGLLLATPFGWIPLIGMFLVPIAIPLGFVVGAIAGHRLDRMRLGLAVSDQPGALFEYLLAAFKAIFGLFGDIFRELRSHFSPRPPLADGQVLEADAVRAASAEERRRALEAVRRTAREHGYNLEQLLPAPSPRRRRRLTAEAPELKGLVEEAQDQDPIRADAARRSAQAPHASA